MKAFRWYGQPGRLKLEDVQIPEVGVNDVLIKVKFSGICGTDLHFRHGRMRVDPDFGGPKLPVTMGHEYAGVVDKIGSDVKGLVEGDRVSIHYSTSDGSCKYCDIGLDNLCLNRADFGYNAGDGGFAEYALVPERNAFILPKQIPMDQGAIIGCAVTTAYHALTTPGRMSSGHSVAVFGVGGVGIHAVQWASVLGASKVIAVDITAEKLRIAKQFGASDTVNAKSDDPVKTILDMTNGTGVDLALDCTSGATSVMDQAIRSTAMAGRTVDVAIVMEKLPVDLRSMMVKESVVAASCNHTRNDHRTVIALVAAGRIDLARSITHRIPFEKINEGIEMLDEKKENIIRIVAEQ